MVALKLLVALLGAVPVEAAKAVFAHFMVENAKTWDEGKWETDIDLARAAHIDGFALNIRSDDKSAYAAMDKAFKVADTKGDFKMMMSFDYAGGGPWKQSTVEEFILHFKSYGSHFVNDDGRPLVSTFEGPLNAGDWAGIKSKTGCYVIPDWSSLGAKQALDASDGVIDGLFAWSAWPWGNTNMNTYVDASYLQFMETASQNWGKKLEYMMPASPWFYTNLPGYDKNWMWRGDSLWFDRWQQIIYLNPDYVQIISWNDFGESHHIGPLYVDGDDYQAFTVGRAPFNFAQDMPHDGWRKFLPFVIDLYKNRKATISQEGITAWYRPSPKQSGCDYGQTTGNTASQLQQEFWPWDIVEDKIFFTALLASNQAVSVTVGGVSVAASWISQPAGGSGLYHGSAAYGGARGAVVVRIGSMTLNGRDITDACTRVAGQNGKQNWNAWVGAIDGTQVNKQVDISKWVCVEGSAPGASEFNSLCEYTCSYGYCPPGACYCSRMGPAKEHPVSTGVVGYPGPGMSASYSGLCNFACNLGYCPPEYCDTQQHPLVVPNVSPFTPDACTSGVGEGNLGGLCGYSCNFGYCPIHSCTCKTPGPLNVPPGQTEKGGHAAPGLDPFIYNGLCNFTCSRGYCPDGACVLDVDENEARNPVYLGTEIWSEPTAHCEPPCVFVLPPSALPSTTTITIGTYVTSLRVGTGTTTITVTPPAITASSILFYNVPVTASLTEGAQFVACTSLAVAPIDVTLTFVTEGQTRITTRELSLPPYPQITQGPPESWTQTCDVWGGGGGGDWDPPSPTFVPTVTTTRSITWPTPTWTDFPPAYFSDANEDDEDDDGDDDENSIVVACDGLWFFSLCVDFPEFKIAAWKIRLPSGIIGPGPPPPWVLFRKGWKITVNGNMPPWPRIEIPPGPFPTPVAPPPPKDCNPVARDVLFETVSQGFSVSNGHTITTAESTITRTATVMACEVTDYTETIASCGANVAKRTAPVTETTAAPEAAEPEEDAHIEARAIVDENDPASWNDDITGCGSILSKFILYPQVHAAAGVDVILQRLNKWKGVNGFDFLEVKAETVDFVAYFVIDNMPLRMGHKLGKMRQVAMVYDYEYFLKHLSPWPFGFGTIGRRETGGGDDGSANHTTHARTTLNRRDVKPSAFDLSQLSAPAGTNWLQDANYVVPNGNGRTFDHYYDATAGSGQAIFVVEASFPPDQSHPEFSGMNVPYFISVPPYGQTLSQPNSFHGAAVAAGAAGQFLGTANKAHLIPVSVGGVLSGEDANERLIHALIMIYDSVVKNALQGKCVINMSWGVPVKTVHPIFPFRSTFSAVLVELHKLGCVLVAASGNGGLDGQVGLAEAWYPAKFLHTKKLPDMLVVGSVDGNARRWETSSYFSDPTVPMVYAWGHDVAAPNPDNSDFITADGTSFAAPRVAGLVAYFRGLPSRHTQSLTDASVAVQLVRLMVRRLDIDDPTVTSKDRAPDSLVWNGQIGHNNCIVNPTTGCPSFLFAPGSGGSSGSSIDAKQGSPSPTCKAECGTLCTGYYCTPKPTGQPPDYADPEAPDTEVSGNNEMMVVYTPQVPAVEPKAWFFMASVVEGVQQDLCEQVEWDRFQSSWFVDPANPGLPPFNSDEINSDGKFKNYGRCSYSGRDGDGIPAGTLSCPDVGIKVNCEALPDTSFTCGENSRHANAEFHRGVKCVL